ncbi:electron transfer flavoprotein subunit beta/FixA family protein [Litorihabitans aurantiacus]|uniref:Electron transfer flavoprotein subunit beta n=1 Tax=Litorihabitans aurantiacus TaxID=1930061 RepID=A0AA37XCX1_9MICO|nr:electron transfer flavoprotein subunit beta [Litorihabitans aurantiacus]GMA30721.1 electron transfer flavoprotein subunit beta [Litorihabitans aurantiacus]
MRVVVLVKQVPDITSERGLDAEGRLERTPEAAVLNELDEGGLETALRAADALGARVVAVTMGPEQASAAARKALQVGAALGVHVCDDALAGSDAVVTARVLARAISLLDDEDPTDPVALVVAGMSSLDGLGSVVPALVAAELGWPVASYAGTVEVTAGEGGDGVGATVTVTRATDHGREELRTSLPAVVGVTDTIAALRVPSFPTMLAARSATLRTLTVADLGLDEGDVGAAGARAVVATAQERPARPPARIVTDTGAAGVALVDFLTERGLVEVSA